MPLCPPHRFNAPRQYDGFAADCLECRGTAGQGGPFPLPPSGPLGGRAGTLFQPPKGGHYLRVIMIRLTCPSFRVICHGGQTFSKNCPPGPRCGSSRFSESKHPFGHRDPFPKPQSKFFHPSFAGPPSPPPPRMATCGLSHGVLLTLSRQQTAHAVYKRQRNACQGPKHDLRRLSHTGLLPPNEMLSYCTWAHTASTKAQREMWLISGLKDHRHLSVKRETYRCKWIGHC